MHIAAVIPIETGTPALEVMSCILTRNNGACAKHGVLWMVLPDLLYTF
ncbi:hypothetical protein ADIARSV_2926 [Arcticibacter svalbardensis MN12-7]|uniref:Uncharacterized protein n=1 Tax=Arcticibacter svalbardensis MN12-7 TaxID=1150600 RepID=R9GQD6_9SPHI|nr:hypothetical protein ADIARSV_2926 [Arcticibacter svalbardensis MN12-7]